MTPPKKTTTGSTGARKRQTGTGKGKSASSKSAARPATSSGRKRGKSKKKRNIAEYVALAFFMGLLVASVCFLFLRSGNDTAEQKLAQPQARSVKVEKTKKAPAARTAPSPLPKIPDNIAREAARKAQVAKRAEAAKALSLQAKSKNTTAGKASRKMEGEGALASAIIDLKALPYEESLSAGLDERIRQVDYAIMQAAWLRKLTAASLRLSRVEDRLEGTQPYQYQVIEILPGKSASAFVKALEECLTAWAVGARLQRDGRDLWRVDLGGVQTHQIRLFPGQANFPQSGDVIDQAEAYPSRDLGFGQARVRKPGETAKLVIVIDDLGASSSALDTLLSLNYPVSFAFWPHGAHTAKGARAAHKAGYDVLVHQPMEPLGYPKVKPGPNVLLTSMSAEQIRHALGITLSEVPYAIGLNNHMGSRFTQWPQGVDTVIDVLREKGLFMLDSVTHAKSVFLAEARKAGMEHYARDVFLDVEPTRDKVLAQLRQAERIALLKGQAIAIGHPLPETLAALKEWQRLRSKEVRIVRLRDLQQY
jgi:polysaccharide deacetylase 2 family uncharacterized protein YibQ